MKRRLVCLILFCFIVTGFSAACASMIARGDCDHKPGTLYPGTRIYVSNFTNHQKTSEDGGDIELGHIAGTFIFAVVAPFWIADMVLTPAYETLALPYDGIQAIKHQKDSTEFPSKISETQ